MIGVLWVELTIIKSAAVKLQNKISCSMSYKFRAIFLRVAAIRTKIWLRPSPDDFDCNQHRPHPGGHKGWILYCWETLPKTFVPRRILISERLRKHKLWGILLRVVRDWFEAQWPRDTVKGLRWFIVATQICTPFKSSRTGSPCLVSIYDAS